MLSIDPKLPKHWKGLSFKINFRGENLAVNIDEKNCDFSWSGNNPINLILRNKRIRINSNKSKKIIYS